MEKGDVAKLIALLEERVVAATADPRQVRFEAPDRQTLLDGGVPAAWVTQLLGAPWWEEMAEEIVETPEFVGADEPPEQVLRYARDVVGEYIRKRFAP